MAYTPGKGTLVKYGATPTTIGQLKKVTPPDSKMNTTDTTHLLSGAKEFLATILECGEPKLVIEYDPANTSHSALWTIHKAGTLTAFQIVFADPSLSTVSFNAIITEYAWQELDAEAVNLVNITLKISGTITGP